MVSIGNVDLVMAALRARLQLIAKEKRAGKAVRTTPADRSELREQSSNSGALQDFSSREFDRELVRVLLEREFGGGVAEDPRFQALVERTCSLLRDDPETEALFRRVQSERI